MVTIKDYQWIMRENTLEVSTTNYYVKIIPRNYNLDLQIFEDGVNVALTLKFLTYEEAIDFTQNVIKNRNEYYPTLDEIKEKYDELNIDKPKALVRKKNNLTSKTNNK